MAQIGGIGYVNFVQAPLSGGTYFCVDGIGAWTKGRVIHDRLTGEVDIPGPNFRGTHSLDVDGLIKVFGITQFQKLNELYADMYLSYAQDVRRGPNAQGGYAGVIDLNTGATPLSCPACGYEWTDYIQMDLYQKCFRSIKSLVGFKSENFSYLKEVLTSNPCPKCDVIIIKNGGGRHMQGSKCNYSFGWDCLGPFINHEFSPPIRGQLRVLIDITFVLGMLIGLDYKICRYLTTLGSIQLWFFWLLYIISKYIFLPFLLMLMVLPGFLFLNIASKEIHSSDSLSRKRAAIFVSLTIMYPVLYLYLWYCLYSNENTYFLVQIMLLELFVVGCTLGGYYVHPTFWYLILLVILQSSIWIISWLLNIGNTARDFIYRFGVFVFGVFTLCCMKVKTRYPWSRQNLSRLKTNRKRLKCKNK